jgi:hypothetical protein
MTPTPLQQVSAALAANEPKDAAEAQQRLWIVVHEPSSRQRGASMVPRIKRFIPPPPPVAWSPDKVGAMTYPEAQRKLWSFFTVSTMPVAVTGTDAKPRLMDNKEAPQRVQHGGVPTTAVVELPSAPPDEAEYAPPPPRRSRVPLLIAAGVVALFAGVGLYAWRRK